MALVREWRARYIGRERAKPSVMLWTKRARKTERPSLGFAWLVAKVMKPSGCEERGVVSLIGLT